MGNEQSTNSSELDELQKQILKNQIEIQQIQMNNLQNKQAVIQNDLNTKSKKELLQSILVKYDGRLTSQQRDKINNMLMEEDLKINVSSRRYDNNDCVEEMEKLKIIKEREEAEKRKIYYQQQQQRKREYEIHLQKLKQDNINTLKLFQLQPQYTMDELKRSYRKLAIKTHPDRPGGSKEKFQVVTKCYFSLIEDLKKREQEKGFDRLRDDSRNYWEEQNEISNDFKNNNPKYDKNKQFNVNKFNEVFNQNKLYDESEEGYEDWLQHGETETPQVFSHKFNINNFNNTFDNWKDESQTTDIIEYQEPEAIVSCNKMNYSDIDKSGKKNYTRVSEKSNDLTYTDLKSAYTKSNLINTKNVKVKSYRDINEYENERSNISYTLTPEQLRQQAIRKQEEEIEEENRVRRIQLKDNISERHYNKVHQMMLSNQ